MGGKEIEGGGCTDPGWMETGSEILSDKISVKLSISPIFYKLITQRLVVKICVFYVFKRNYIILNLILIIIEKYIF